MDDMGEAVEKIGEYIHRVSLSKFVHGQTVCGYVFGHPVYGVVELKKGWRFTDKNINCPEC